MTIKQNTKKPLEKFHLTVIVDRKIEYTDDKTGKVTVYKEDDHIRPFRQGYDKMNDSRVVEAASYEEAKKILLEELAIEHQYEEYSSSAIVKIANVQFIDDPIEESQIVSSDAKNIPMRQMGHLEYNFTTQEQKYLTDEITCVIDISLGFMVIS